MLQEKPRVYVTQENANQNYVPAEKFGEVRFLTRGELSPIRGSMRNREVLEQVRDGLLDFNPDCDFLAPSGSPLITGIAFATLALRGVTRFTALRWSNRDQAYTPVPIQL